MKSCKQCGREQIRDFDVYCPNCGSKDLQVWTEKNILDAGNYEIAPMGSRIAAALIDLLILILIGLLDLAPPLNLAAAAASFSYALLRDVKGASLGKHIMHLKVLSKSGRPATTGQLIGRNVIFALPSLAYIFPFIGILITNVLYLVLIIIELVLWVSTRNRIGDRLASTMVVKQKTAATS
jgi:uncharacterized RDD family membrane protein YckC